ncbi:MAG: hypothetical protein NTW28_05350 [Candidatus Solibacter sp.]|nr:hypothetical protein [Candidatus Solibacter sp.]
MSDDWLERQLARDLAPVTAPDTLGIRLGFCPSKRGEFPRAALAVAAAVVMIIAGGYAASRTAGADLRPLASRESRGTVSVEFASTDPVVIAAWLRREAGVDVPRRPAEGVRATGARLLRCDGGATIPLQVNAGKATVLLAHSGIERRAHTLAAPSEAGCRLCHTL